MTNKTKLQRAYILHCRPYRETSLLLDCFTEHDGRVSILARGLRRNRSPVARLFCDYWLGYTGKSELKTLVELEYAELTHHLHGMALFSGYYLNELLLKLIEKEAPMTKLWHLYHTTIKQISYGTKIAPLLREFELGMLDELGYGFQLDETRSGEPLNKSKAYIFEFSHGLEPYRDQAITSTMSVYSGAELLAIQARDWQVSQSLSAAKRLLSLVIDQLLGGKPLKSRYFAQKLLRK